MNRLPLFLTIIGAVPFIVFSAGMGLHLFPHPHATARAFLTYSAIIISFLGGTHWGIAVLRRHEHRPLSNLLIAESVWAPLLAWGLLFYADVFSQLLVMTLLYAFIWAVDSLLYSKNIIPQWFFDISCILTPIAVVSLYVGYFGLI